jgi:hypothetical protein
MADCRLVGGCAEVAHTHLAADGFLKRHEFFVGDSAEERLQKDDSLTEARVQIVVGSIHGIPVGTRICGGAACQIIRTDMELAAKIHDHLKQGADFVEELGTLG